MIRVAPRLAACRSRHSSKGAAAPWGLGVFYFAALSMRQATIPDAPEMAEVSILRVLGESEILCRTGTPSQSMVWTSGLFRETDSRTFPFPEQTTDSS
ncbi:hypothetical protein [Streptomyces sp. NPDC058249]|uniref:hypothetical protein n=1 Tax=Streptomyces sp. NPDC058249 TaxID=3346403 RepID=UPI0036EE0896